MSKEQRLEEEFVWSRILPRPADSHKGSFGSVLAAAGSARYRGAAGLTAEGALRTGAGIVTLASVEPVIQAAAARLPECCFLPCAATAEGNIAGTEAGKIAAALGPKTVLLLGPGLGNTADARTLVRRLLPAAGAAVLDADGLNAAAALLAAGEPLPRPAQGGALVLTPHPGEMARLTGLSTAQINAAREQTACFYAAQWQCVLVLKGHCTVIAAPDGRTWVNATGNPGLARGGSGDILAGMIAGLLACGLEAAEAAACAVWLHGAAADRTARRLGQYGMLPHDLFLDLGQMFAARGR